jgi:hypothetical protein
MNRKLFAALVLLGVFFVCAVPGLFAQTQTTGAIAGTITDPANAAVPSAAVTLQSIEKGTSQTATSGASGEYRFDLLLPGSYTVSVKASGFQTLLQKATVTVGQVSIVDLRLALGAQTQTITVEAATPLLQAENANVAATISETQAQNIPNPGNDITFIAQMAPGSVMNTGGGGLGNFSSYGISATSNLFTMNGMDNNDPFLNLNDSGATNLMLGQNEIQEVSVVTNGYSVEYGGLAGANVNYVTRSGTNDWHGRATWYWNGRTMNANDWFLNNAHAPRGFVNANQYGADFGGPIVKNKLFFYVNAEGLYLVIPAVSTVFVPSPQFESAVTQNIATQFPGNPTIQSFYANVFKLYNGAPQYPRATPVQGGGCDGSEVAFNGVVPGAPIFGAGGAPCALTFQSSVGNTTHENLQSYRMDWNVTNNDRVFFRYQHDKGIQATFTDPINALFNTQSTQPEDQGQLNETHSFANGAVNQLVLSGQWYSAIFGNKDFAATQAAFPGTMAWGGGQYSLLGGIDYLFPQGRNVTQFQVSDDFTKPHGSHTFKAGLKFRRNWISNHDYTITSTGLTIPLTLDAFFWGGADAANPSTPAGTPNISLLNQAFPTFPAARFAVYTVGGYFEDDWRVKPKLTLTLGFRLDHPSNPVCFVSCFVLAAVNFPGLSANPNTPYNQLLKTGVHQMLPSLQGVEPQPRFGLAWQVMPNTVVRGGFGIFYDNYPGALLDGLSENPPNDPTFTVAGSNLSYASDPTSLFANAASSNAGFQSGFGSGGSLNSISTAVPAFAPPSLAATINHPEVMRVYKWSLDVQRQFGANTSIDLAYIGNHGAHIYFQNQGINGCVNPFSSAFTDLPNCPLLVGPFPFTTVGGLNPNFTRVAYALDNAISNYHGFTTSFTHRYASGLVQVNYSWSHALDSVSNSGVPGLEFSNTGFGATNTSITFPENPANVHQFNYGSSDYDVRQSLNLNYVWELPIKKLHGPSRLVNGWFVNGAMYLRSGFPLTLYDNTTSSALQGGGYGDATNAVQVFGVQTSAGGSGQNCRTLFGSSQPSRNNCLDESNFATPTNGPANSCATPPCPNPLYGNGFGNVTRNTFRGPGYWNTDFALMKHTKITERVEFVFGAQFFNVFNHSNFDAPVMDVSSSHFGQILKTTTPPTTMYGSVLGADAAPRLIQLKTQLIF